MSLTPIILNGYVYIPVGPASNDTSYSIGSGVVPQPQPPQPSQPPYNPYNDDPQPPYNSYADASQPQD